MCVRVCVCACVCVCVWTSDRTAGATRARLDSNPKCKSKIQCDSMQTQKRFNSTPKMDPNPDSTRRRRSGRSGRRGCIRRNCARCNGRNIRNGNPCSGRNIRIAAGATPSGRNGRNGRNMRSGHAALYCGGRSKRDLFKIESILRESNRF